MKKSDFDKHLKANKCILHRQGSNHEIWINPRTGKQTSVPRHKELVNVICKVICKQLEIPVPEKI